MTVDDRSTTGATNDRLKGDTSECSVPIWGGSQSINPDEVRLSGYITLTQTLHIIQRKLHVDEAQARWVVAEGIYRRVLLAWWDHSRMPHPDVPLRQLRHDLPPHDRVYWATASTHPSDPDYLREPIWDELADGTRVPARSDEECGYRRPLFHHGTLENWIREFKRAPSVEATEADVRRVLCNIYDAAAAEASPPPNVNKAKSLAQARLLSEGLRSSQEFIKQIADERGFVLLRAKPGPKPRQP